MKLSDSQFSRIGKMVLNETGILLRPQNRKFIEKRFARLVKANNMQTVYEIEAALLGEKNTPLKIQIIESVLNFDTGFFRGRESFRFLRQSVLPKLMSEASKPRTLKFWSAGCSTGQEAYSLSIILDEFLSKDSHWKVEIFATDMSRRCLEKARIGIYSANDVEDSVPKKFLNRHFEKNEAGWKVSKRHRDRVTFREHNLLHDWSDVGIFDVILMRDVLTYVLSPYKRKVAMHAYEHISDSGFFMLGKEEVPGVGHFFTPASGKEEACFKKNLDVGQGARLKKLATSKREMNPVLKEKLNAMLLQSEMFRGLSKKSIKSISEKFEVHKIRPGQKVVRQGHMNKDFFLIYEGEASVTLDRGLFKKDLEISRLVPGDVFGVTSLVAGEVSSANVVADGVLRVFVGSQALFDALAHRSASFREYVVHLREKHKKEARRGEARSKGFAVDPTVDDIVAPILIPEELQHLMMSPVLRSLLLKRGGKELAIGPSEADRFKLGLRQVPLFADMELSEMDDYVALSEYWVFPAESRIVEVGDTGHALYMLASGKANIVKEGRVVDSLSRGQIFGENSLVNLVPETVDVIASEKIHLFIVGVELFRYVVDGEVDEELSRTLGVMSGRIKLEA